MPVNNSTKAIERTNLTCPKKRLFVCCDGTWMDAVGTDNPLTNVARLSRCIKPVSLEDGDPVLQIVHYQTGIGRGTSKVGRLIDGATGRGGYLPLPHSFGYIT
ncbi:hypothetical protein F5Y11DRAFT_313871 [Daldinia sp. FL1419]|nr:hypothetical protein F5Y11DRAFT_313871 [Daldinia sp. FL1419]